jgi:hypothetical protein
MCCILLIYSYFPFFMKPSSVIWFRLVTKCLFCCFYYYFFYLFPFFIYMNLRFNCSFFLSLQNFFLIVVGINDYVRFFLSFYVTFFGVPIYFIFFICYFTSIVSFNQSHYLLLYTFKHLGKRNMTMLICSGWSVGNLLKLGDL